ncbi:MAG: site-specific integrase [Alphaproteobacteria bacterium]|nr:site-specific integrase [Alphaproteobacteria bacterium]
MAVSWKSVVPGIRYREHETRKHGIRPDRYFTLRFYVNGRRVEEALGWASDGWTVAKAQEELAKLRETKRTGKGEATLRDKREANLKAKTKAIEEETSRARQERTVADLWNRYAKEVMALENKPRTIAEKTRLWEKRVMPAIGALKLKDVTEEDAGSVVRSPLRLDKDGKVIGGKAEAGNLYRLLHHLFSKALAWHLRPKEMGNPLENIAEPKVPRRERLLTAGEIGALMKALEQAEKKGSELPQVTAIFKAAIFTGWRISELLSLQWGHIRPEEMEAHLPDTKTGFSRRPLSAETLAVFESLERMPGVPHVFRAASDPTEALSYDTVEGAFRRIRQLAGVPNCSLHTIRHWFATMTANAVSNPRVGMALTGHKSHAAYMNYIHGDKDQARALADQLTAFAKGLGKSESPVVPLRKQG